MVTSTRPAPAVLYIQRGCAICLQVRRFLEQRGVEFEIKWLSDPENMLFVDQQRAKGVKAAAPWLVVGDDTVTGYDPDAILTLLAAGGHEIVEPAGHGMLGASGDPVELPPAALWVANLGDGSLSFLDPGSNAKLVDDLPLGAGGMPCAIGFDPESDVVVVTDFALDRIVLFDRARGTFLHDDLEASLLPMPEEPGDVAFDARRHRFYIPCHEGRALVTIDSTTGSYLGGSLEVATLPLGFGSSNAIDFDPGLDTIYLRSGGIAAIDAERLELRTGDHWGEVAAGFGRDVKVDAERHVVYVPGYGHTDDEREYHRVVYLDARTGAPLHGDLDASSAATDPTPWSLMPDPSTGRVFVACMGTQSVQAFSSDEPRAASEPIRTGAAQRAMVLRDREHMICISSFDDSTVTYLDTRDVTYRFGDETASTAKTGTGPRGMYFVEPPA